MVKNITNGSLGKIWHITFAQVLVFAKFGRLLYRFNGYFPVIHYYDRFSYFNLPR